MINRGIGTWLERRRRSSAGEIAIVSARGELSYGEFADRTVQLASALQMRGVRAGDRVAYVGENDPSFLETLFATGAVGGIFVPLNTRLAVPEIQFALQDSAPSVLVVSGGLWELGVKGAKDTPVSLLVYVSEGAEQTPNPQGIETVNYEELVAPESTEQGAVELPDVAVDLDDPAVILYTSGTTGSPKGAVLTHGNLTWNAFNVIVDYDVTSRDVALMIAPMFHVAALGMGALPTLLKGGRLVLERRFDAGLVLRLIQQHRVTTISGVPTTYQMLAEHPAWDGADLSSLRNLTCGGSAVPLRVLDAFEDRGLSFRMGYGMTETASGVTTLPGRYSREKQGSAGIPHFHTFTRVAGPDGAACAPGEVGEIQVQGPNVISEYWNRPDATASSWERAEDGNWFRTGDMGSLDEDGFLFISDRLKDMFIAGGENIYPAQVEQQIAQLPHVAGVAVIGVPDERWGEVGRAVIMVHEGQELTEQEVLEHLDGRLAHYKIPKSAVFVTELPRTASGKIRKPDLRSRFGQP